jgi:magnesium-transporting ATPase (P-type)
MSTPTSKAFLQRSTFIHWCTLLLLCLVLFYVTLLALRATNFFEKHLFDLSSIGSVTQATAIATQTWTVIVLITLSYAVQVVSSDAIVRRRKRYVVH